MNIVIAVNNKPIERYIESRMPTVTVLSIIKKRAEVVDTILKRNPHTLILSPSLAGKMEMREIVSSCRKLKPDTKIVYLYGERDSEYKSFLDFLVKNGVYDIVLDEITEESLTKSILENATWDAVSCYLLTPEEKEKITAESAAEPASAAEENTNLVPKTKVLIVEKFIGNITIAVAGLFPRCGCTHTAIEICNYLSGNKLDAGLVVNEETYSLLCEYYITEESGHTINGCHVYDNLSLAKQKHKIVVFDLGNIAGQPAMQGEFYNHSVPLLICPAAPWEIDRLTDFIKDNEFSAAIKYLFYPVSDRQFRELHRNLLQGGCKSFLLRCSADPFSSKDNAKTFDELLRPVIEQAKKL